MKTKETISADERELLERFEHAFGVDPELRGETHLVLDAECETVAECKDPKMAALIARLLTEFWNENWKP